jgi:hypothetical protein
MTCHQGNSSTVDVNQAVADLPVNQPSAELEFINIHYFAAGASRYGGEVQGGYEFNGKNYLGYFEHVEGYQTCTDCHDAHELQVQTNDCFTCHSGADTVEEIRMSEIDYDGDGDLEEGVSGEIETLIGALYESIQAYAAANSEPIIYDSTSYPYFFVDTNADGSVDPGEAIYPNNYQESEAWTPNLLKAAYNFQYAQKDPGAFAHNPEYVIQLLIDSIDALGGSTAGFTRPQ